MLLIRLEYSKELASDIWRLPADGSIVQRPDDVSYEKKHILLGTQRPSGGFIEADACLVFSCESFVIAMDSERRCDSAKHKRSRILKISHAEAWYATSYNTHALAAEATCRRALATILVFRLSPVG